MLRGVVHRCPWLLALTHLQHNCLFPQGVHWVVGQSKIQQEIVGLLQYLVLKKQLLDVTSEGGNSGYAYLPLPAFPISSPCPQPHPIT